MSYFLPPKTSMAPPGVAQAPALRAASQPPGTPHNVERSQDSSHSSSVGGWMRNMFPSKKPERGGTAREGGYWEQLDPSDPRRRTSRRHIDESHHSRHSDTGESDRITRWNTASDTSETQALPTLPHRRAVSAGVNAAISSPADRKWNWLPRDRPYGQPPDDKAPRIAVSDESEASAPADASALDASNSRPSKVADRRLSRARRLIEDKKEAHRQRRNLRESGDYLGVQGINPLTGQPDVVTPSDSDKSGGSEEKEQKLEALRKALKNTPTSFRETSSHKEKEVKKRLLEIEMEKLQRRQRGKEDAQSASQGVKWRRHTKQWSTAQEPSLSPIVQSAQTSRMPSRAPQPRREAGPDEEQSQTSGTSSNTQGDSDVPMDSVPTPKIGEETSASSSTVVRTPQGQSLGRTLPTRGQSRPEDIVKDTGASCAEEDEPGASLASPPRHLAGHFKDSRMAQAVPRPRPDSRPALRVGTTERTKSRVGPIPSQNTESSFLDRRVVGAFDATRTNRKTVHLATSRTEDLAKKPDPRPRRSFSLVPRKNSFSLLPGESRNQRESSAPALLTTHRSLGILRTTAQPSTGDARSHRAFEESPLRRLKPQLLSLVKKKSYGNEALTNHARTVPTRASGPVTDMKESGGVVVRERGERLQEAKPQENSLPAKNMIHRDMMMLREQVAWLDGLNGLDSEVFRRARSPFEADHEWMEDTIRDISRKGGEIMGESACTPIITTTGSGLQTYESNLRDDSSSETEEWETTRTRCSPIRATCKPPEMSPRESSSTSSLTRAPSSTEPRLELAREIRLGDITSVGYLASMKQRSGTLVRKSTGALRSLKTEGQRCSTSPMSTSMAHLDLAQSRAAGKGHVKAAKPAGVEGPTCGIQEQGARRIVDRSVSRGRARQPRAETPPSMPQHGTNYPEEDLEGMLQRTPGSYPSHLDGEGDTAGRSGRHKASRLHSQRAPEAAEEEFMEVWNATKELVGTIRCRGIVALRLYWKVVGPVLRSKLGHSQNKMGRKNSWSDSVAMVLAVPGAIVAAAVLV